MFNGNLSSGDPGGNVGTFRQWLDPILTGSCLCCRWICYCTVCPGDTSWRMISRRHGGLTAFHRNSTLLMKFHDVIVSTMPISSISKIIHLFTIMSQNKRAQRAYRRAKGRDRHAMSQQLELSSPQAGSRMDVRWRRL